LSDKKITVMTISDHPLLPSGVGTQTKNVIEALLDSGKFKVISLGGAIKHPDYKPMMTEEYKEDWVVFPVDEYGNKETLRSFLLNHKPDILYFMTDPRFYHWLWAMEDEIRKNIPMVYYHVWDNYPMPHFNRQWYLSNDCIASISKVTSDIVQTVCPEVREQYVPHAVDTDVFKKRDSLKDKKLLDTMKTNGLKDKFIFFWNNRNARRKQSGSLIFWFKTFLDKIGHDQATLLMHTATDDPHGQPLEFLIQHLGLDKGQVLFSKEKIPPKELSYMYNMADCTINISDAEGFGLSTLESLACETPIIVNMTGGLQEQVTDGTNWFGVGLSPASKAVIGSHQVPFIYEDRLSESQVVQAMEKMYYMSEDERQEVGARGRAHVMKNYNYDTFQKTWVDLMLDIHQKMGSWETRTNYQPWECKEI